MKRKGRSYYIRKAHRYLGVFIGIQFLLWTAGGLYFSWTTIDVIRGDDLYQPPAIAPDGDAISPVEALNRNLPEGSTADLAKMRVVSVLGENHYSFVYKAADGRERRMLVRTDNGERRKDITEDEARRIAAGSLREPIEAVSAEFITDAAMSGHHEYREKPLPAWWVALGDENGLTAYVGAEDGQIHAIRTNGWRVFDFLWMLHTMDFAGRDNINNYVLRTFSVLGIVTVSSGFLLFFISSKTVRRLLRQKQPKNGS